MIGRTNAGGSGGLKNPLIAKTQSELQKYLKKKYNGAFVKFQDPAYQFTVPKSFKLRLELGTVAPVAVYNYSGINMDWRMNIDDTLAIVKQQLEESSASSVKIITIESENGAHIEVYCGSFDDTVNNVTSYMIWYTASGVDSNTYRIPLWFYNIYSGGPALSASVLSNNLDIEWSTIDSTQLKKIIKTGINGYLNIPDIWETQFSNLSNSFGIYSLLYFLLVNADGSYLKKFTGTITQITDFGRKLIAIEEESEFGKEQIYNIIRDDSNAMVMAASPLAVGDSWAGRTLHLNQDVNKNKINELINMLDWEDSLKITGNVDEDIYIYMLTNSEPDYGIDGGIGDTDIFNGILNASLDYMFVYYVPMLGAMIFVNGEPIWFSGSEDASGLSEGWQTTNSSVTISSSSIKSTVTNINGQILLNSLFGKTNSFITEPEGYALREVVEAGFIKTVGVPVGNNIMEYGGRNAGINKYETTMDELLSDSRNLGKVFRYTGGCSNKYTVGGIYFVEEEA